MSDVITLYLIGAGLYALVMLSLTIAGVIVARDLDYPRSMRRDSARATIVRVKLLALTPFWPILLMIEAWLAVRDVKAIAEDR